MENSREKILMHELFADHYKLADRFDEAAEKVGTIANVMSGTPNRRGLLGDLQEISESISEASKALDPIVGAALPEKIDHLKKLIDAFPSKLIEVADSLEFRSRASGVLTEELRKSTATVGDGIAQSAIESIAAHLHGECGKHVAEAVNTHLAEPMAVTGRLAKLEAENEALNVRCKALLGTIDQLSSGKVNRWLIKAWFLGGAIGGILASSGWEVFTTWVLGQPIPFPLPWR